MFLELGFHRVMRTGLRHIGEIAASWFRKRVILLQSKSSETVGAEANRTWEQFMQDRG